MKKYKTWIVIGLFLVGAYFIYNSNKSKADTTTTPPVDKDNDGKDDNTQAPIDTRPNPYKTGSKIRKCFEKRTSGNFKMKSQKELQEIMDFLHYDWGWSLDQISYGAALLKGMDVDLTIENFQTYEFDIIDFQNAKPRILRKSPWRDEIAAQVYAIGSLLCESPEATQYPTNTNTNTNSGASSGTGTPYSGDNSGEYQVPYDYI